MLTLKSLICRVFRDFNINFQLFLSVSILTRCGFRHFVWWGFGIRVFHPESHVSRKKKLTSKSQACTGVLCLICFFDSSKFSMLQFLKH